MTGRITVIPSEMVRRRMLADVVRLTAMLARSHRMLSRAYITGGSHAWFILVEPRAGPKPMYHIGRVKWRNDGSYVKFHANYFNLCLALKHLRRCALEADP